MSSVDKPATFSDVIKKRIEEKQLQLLEKEYSAARAEFKSALEAKEHEIGEYEKKNQELEKWVVDTQARLETEVVSKQELESKLEDIKQAYWASARENFERLDARLADYESARTQILKLEEELQSYKTQLAEVRDRTEKKEKERPQRQTEKEQHLSQLINRHIAATLTQDKTAHRVAAAKLHDTTPIFE